MYRSKLQKVNTKTNTKQNKTKQNKTKQNKTKQNKKTKKRKISIRITDEKRRIRNYLSNLFELLSQKKKKEKEIKIAKATQNKIK